MAHDVFLSYATPDKTVADMACAVLEREGVRVWIAPRDVLAGADYPAQLTAAIESANVLVAVWSEHFDASQHTKREVEIAVSLGKHVLPLRIADVPMDASSRYLFAGKHWLDAITPPIEAHLARLASTVKALLGQDPQPATPLPARARRGSFLPALALLAIVGLAAWLVLRDGRNGGARPERVPEHGGAAASGDGGIAASVRAAPPQPPAADPLLTAFVQRHATGRHPFAISRRRADGQRWGWQGDVRFTPGAGGTIDCEIRRPATAPHVVSLRIDGDLLVGATIRDFTGEEASPAAALSLGLGALPPHVSVDLALAASQSLLALTHAMAQDWSLVILPTEPPALWIAMFPGASRNDETLASFDLPSVNSGLACLIQTRVPRGFAPLAEHTRDRAFRFRGQFTVRDEHAGSWNGAVVTIDVTPGIEPARAEFEHRIQGARSTVDFDVYVPRGSQRVDWSIENSAGEVLWNALRLEATVDVKLAEEKLAPEPVRRPTPPVDGLRGRVVQWAGRPIPTVWMRRLGDARRAERRDWRLESVEGDIVRIATNPDRPQELANATLRDDALEVPVPRYALDRDFTSALRFVPAELQDDVSAGTLAGHFALLAAAAPKASTWFMLDLEPGLVLASSLASDLRTPNGEAAAIEGGRAGLDPFTGSDVQIPVGTITTNQAFTMHGSMCVPDRYGRRARAGSPVTVSVDGVTKFSEVVGDRMRVDFAAEVPAGALHVRLVGKPRSGEAFTAVWNCVWLEPKR
ncbi:MAG: toll/interleukin-1 receptor domain-containing protein [Planctomycetes bacterium]|nr:toll/interleukin-1 receptor domain-containing protein [Planctomycetota bacterium]